MKNNLPDNDEALLNIKADELIQLLKKGSIDKEHIKAVQQKINNAVDNNSGSQKFDAFSVLNQEQSRLDMVTNLELLLTQHPVDSRESKKYLLHEKLKRIVLIGISVTMIVLGLAMIIMPAPPYFEMFTIFYFSKDDGITLMDVISVLIVLTGVYLFINAILRKINS
ncbi:hypothetical protein SAMN05192574_104696 [Mucilaginibacter gossypiicola]|uniref:Uncharacterized protein n=1 Tax=Mucilaginibacter gossypiicola TaxID=551995 RepID=A0A1H8KNQ4_9SPHI|nr:hypothetical protein [Mucilaginibacter gossypiicola]SEN94477.1 hypothetical protein SAMN05192574_104696 [Mucilaginibacter gossypiicola]